MFKVSSEAHWNPAVLSRLKACAKINSVEVGYPDDETYPNGQKVSDIAWKNEFGSARTPPRPFIRPTIASRGGHWFRKVRDGYVHAKTESALTKMFADLGKGICVNLQQSIDRVNAPPLSDATIARRKAKGNDSKKPLVDTGKMRDSISYRVGQEGAWQR